MPCYDPSTRDYVYSQNQEIANRLNEATRLLCEFCEICESLSRDVPPTFREWWERHKAEDRERDDLKEIEIRRRRAQERLRRLRSKVLKRLSLAEKQALGIA